MTIFGIALTMMLPIALSEAEQLRLPGIKGTDSRQLISTTDHPWSAIGRVNRRTGGHCTGVVVAANKVLTAAHCLWNKRTQKYFPVESLHFVTGYSRGEHLSDSSVKSFSVSPNYLTPPSANQDPANDWAVLTLNADMTDVTQPLDILPLKEDDLARFRSEGARFVQGGYSQDKAHILTVHDGCALLDLGDDTRMIFHDCDATHGDSGSPIMRYKDATYTVIGIHVATANFAGRSVGISAAAYQAKDALH